MYSLSDTAEPPTLSLSAMQSTFDIQIPLSPFAITPLLNYPITLTRPL